MHETDNYEIIRYYEPILKDRYDDQKRRGRDLEHFQVLCEGYDGLQRLLSDMSLDPPSRARCRSRDSPSAAQTSLGPPRA